MGVGMRRMGFLLALLAVVVSSASSQQLAPQPDEDGVYPPLRGVTTAKLLHAVPAVVPADPRLEGLKHVCTLDVTIGADGIPVTVEILNKITTPFDEPAKLAVKQSQFEAGSFQGNPVTTRLMVWVPFFGKDHPAIPVASPTNTIKDFKVPVPIIAPEPEFSDAARFHHTGGVVLVRFLVTEEGLPARSRVLVHAEYGLDEKAGSSKQVSLQTSAARWCARAHDYHDAG
jgi:hypothetical protein